jgi:hypothetical protein
MINVELEEVGGYLKGEAQHVRNIMNKIIVSNQEDLFQVFAKLKQFMT